jgi:hypothetical protein
MEIRSRIAAETAAVVPFHCIICFEEFNLHERLPVVLPCGHTFVCAPCSKRLKRCMECREPLFYTIPKHNNNNINHSKGPSSSSSSPMTCASQSQQQPARQSRLAATTGVNNISSSSSSGGGRYSPAPLTPPHPSMGSSPPHPSTVTKVLFPIPKNLVLIAMMEAARSAQKPALLDGDLDTSEQVPFIDDSSLNQNDGDEFDLKRILTGVATLSGSCGTFVVKAKEGLSILPSIPDIQGILPTIPDVQDPAPPRAAVTAGDSKLTVADLNISGDDHHHPARPILEEGHSSPLDILEPPLRLEQGQTVQVVTFDDGYAKLARGMGFVKAKHNELVKGMSHSFDTIFFVLVLTHHPCYAQKTNSWGTFGPFLPSRGTTPDVGTTK